MKRFWALLLSGLLLSAACLAGCGDPSERPKDDPNDDNPPVSEEPQYEYLSLLTDPTFKNGFLVRGLGRSIYDDEIELCEDEKTDPKPDVCFQYDKEGLPKPDWRLAQWASRYSFRDTENAAPGLPADKINYSFEELGEGRYKYENSSKRIVVDTNTGEYSLGLKASECFKEPRVQNQEWPHWFIERDIHPHNPPRECHIASSQALNIRFDVRLNEFTDHMGDSVNPDLHSALCVFYLYISNLNPKTNMFDDMLWFGLTVFDNRYVFGKGASFPDGGKESHTGKWIYNVAGTEFLDPDNNLKTPDNEPVFGKWVSVDIDVLAYVHEAFQAAKRAGFMKNAALENLYVNGMYFGYETPGTYDIDMSYRNVNIRSLTEIQ